jgi:uncharacterized protein
MYTKGQGVPQDFVQAFHWFGKAADQENADAEASLGWMYAKGLGAPQDFAQAVHWFGKAADKGSAYAQINLGLLYAEGNGLPQDYRQALMWSNLAITRAEDDATREFAVNFRDAVAAKMTPSQIDEAQRMADERCRK